MRCRSVFFGCAKFHSRSQPGEGHVFDVPGEMTAAESWPGGFQGKMTGAPASVQAVFATSGPTAHRPPFPLPFWSRQLLNELVRAIAKTMRGEQLTLLRQIGSAPPAKAQRQEPVGSRREESRRYQCSSCCLQPQARLSERGCRESARRCTLGSVCKW